MKQGTWVSNPTSIDLDYARNATGDKKAAVNDQEDEALLLVNCRNVSNKCKLVLGNY